MKNDKLKNGIELLLSLALSLDLLEQYNSKQIVRKKINIAKEEIEKSIASHYNPLFKENEHFVQNSLNFKEKAIKTIAKLNEADCILACDYLEKFVDNIDKHRQQANVNFEKL